MIRSCFYLPLTVAAAIMIAEPVAGWMTSSSLSPQQHQHQHHPIHHRWPSSLSRTFSSQDTIIMTQQQLSSHCDYSHHNSQSRSFFPLYSSSNTEEMPSLYKEQEKLLVNRGVYEGELMAHTGSPLETHVLKGVGSQGGFGGGFAKKKTTPSASLRKTQAKAYGKHLRTDGVIRLDHVLSTDTAQELRAWLYQYRAESEQLVQSGACVPRARFADVLLKENRCDMPVPLGKSPLIAQALYEVLCVSPIGAILTHLLGDDATLYELSSLMSDPGSQRQVVHPDTPYLEERGDDPTMYTCFIALQDITPEMGPTTWLPGTHTKEMHEIFQHDDDGSTNSGADGDENTLSPKDHLLQTRPSKLGILPTGSCGLYDSRVLHCGGANQSTDPTNSRALFYMSFKSPHVGYPGNPASIRPELAGEWTLKELMREGNQFAKGKANKLVAEDAK